MIAYVITSLINSLGFAVYFQVLEVDGQELRRNPQEHEYATNILLVLAQCISIIAPLLLPLVWIDLANAAFTFRRRSICAVKCIPIAFCFLVCFVQFPLYVLAANNYEGGVESYGDIASAIWYVVYGFLIFINVFAALRVFVVRRTVAQRPKSEMNQRFVKLLIRIYRAAILLVITFSLAIFLIYESQPRDVSCCCS